MILMYHNIAAEADFNTVAKSAFARHLQFIMQERRIISIEEYVQSLVDGGDSDGYAVLTFDDGYVSFQTHVLPVLEQFAIPAALFIPVNNVGGTNTWEREGTPVFHLLSWDDLIRISGHDLVTIGSHGLSHRSMRTLPRQEQRDEVADSKGELEGRTGREIAHFCYPYGQRIDFTDETSTLIRQSGYRSACSTLYGRSNRLKEQYALRRIEIRPYDTFDQFRKLCTKNMHMVYLKQQMKEFLQRFTA